MTVYYWDLGTQAIKETSVYNFVNSPLYLMFTLILIGVSGAGKTEFAKALGAWLAIAHGFPYVCETDELDVLGVMTKNRAIEEVGAFIFNDFHLNSKGKRLNVESQKKFFRVANKGAFEARQGDADCEIEFIVALHATAARTRMDRSCGTNGSAATR